MREERFKFEEVEKITPSCKYCKFAINNGVDGCEEDHQTLEIKFGEEKCDFEQEK